MGFWSLENVPWTNMHDLNLDWIINTMKETVEQWIAYKTEMDSNYEQFTTNIETWKNETDENFIELQTYVHDYFDNLDLNESTRYVINNMIESGEFIEVLNPSIVESVETWLSEHITPTSPVVDDTLTISGAAADSAIVGKVLEDIVAEKYSNNSTYTIGDYCLYNNALYICNTDIDTAESWTNAHWTKIDITANITNLKSALYNTDSMLISNEFDWTKLLSSSPTGFRTGYYNETTGVYTTSNRWLCTAVRTLKFESYDGMIITPPNSYKVFVTEYIDNTFIKKHGSSTAINEAVFVPLIPGHNYGITVGNWPDGTATDYNNNDFLSNLKCSLITTDNRVFKFRGKASDLGYTQITDFDQNGWYQLPSNYIQNISGLPEDYPANTGGFIEIFKFNDSLSSVSYKKWIVLHASTGAAWLNFVFADETVSGWRIMTDPSNQFAGKTLSLLGASGSSFVGYVPEGNDAYYTGENDGVTSVDQMWWKIVCDHFGMIPLVIDAWSGSAVCYNAATDAAHSDTRKIPMCSDLRTGRLAQNGVSPDVIIVVGGTNDWTYSKSTTTPIGDWNGRSAVDETAVTSGESTFMESYASMINKLKVNYPEAIIVCFSCIFTGRGTSLGITKINDMGLTENDYNNAIKKVCNILGVPFLDVYNVGFTYQNYYPTYAEDSSTQPTHPNATGHTVIAKRVIDKLPDLIAQFINAANA